MADNRLFKLEIVCPDRMFYEGEAHMIEFTTSEGDIGVYKDHIPLTTIIAPGVLTIKEENGEKYAAIHGGFAQILQDKVTLLAEAAEWPEEIDLERAQSAKERAQKLIDQKGDGEVNVARAEAALQRALARIDIKK